MRRLDEAFNDLVERRPATGTDALIDTLRRRLEGEATAVAPTSETNSDTMRTKGGWRGPLTAAGAVAAVFILLALPILWLGGSDKPTSADEAPRPTATVTPPTTMTPRTSGVEATTILVPPATVLSSHLEPAGLELGDEIGFSQSGDTLWVWDGEGGVAGYRDGAWQAFPPLPGPVSDVAGTMGGPVWAVTERNLWYLEGADWRTLPKNVALSADSEIEYGRVEVDRSTGMLWLLNSAGLFRWDGAETLQVASSAEAMRLDDFVLAGDGSIWSGRDNFYHPEDDRLARLDQDTGAWESARPLGGTDDLPASVAITPEGTLWVGLRDPEAQPSDPTGFVLAKRDTAGGKWSTYRLSAGSLGDIVAHDDVVWFHGPESELFRFDGETSTVFSPGGLIDNLGLGNDGTLWVSIRYETNGVYRLVIDGEDTE